MNENHKATIMDFLRYVNELTTTKCSNERKLELRKEAVTCADLMNYSMYVNFDILNYLVSLVFHHTKDSVLLEDAFGFKA